MLNTRRFIDRAWRNFRAVSNNLWRRDWHAAIEDCPDRQKTF
jgi:hypothetical protein